MQYLIHTLKKHRAFIIVIILVFLVFAFINRNNIITRLTDKMPGYTVVSDYVPPTGGIGCQALSPECGVCFGVIKNNKCYVKNECIGELNNYKCDKANYAPAQ